MNSEVAEILGEESEKNCTEEEGVMTAEVAEVATDVARDAGTTVIQLTGPALEQHVKQKLAGMLIVAGTEGAYYAVPIVEFLRAKIDDAEIGAKLKNAIAQNTKNWTNLWKYIVDNVRKKAVNNVACETDEAVFRLVLDYFWRDDAAEAEKEKAAAEAKKAAKKTEAKKAETKKTGGAKTEAKKEAEKETEKTVFDDFDFDDLFGADAEGTAEDEDGAEETAEAETEDEDDSSFDSDGLEDL